MNIIRDYSLIRRKINVLLSVIFGNGQKKVKNKEKNLLANKLLLPLLASTKTRMSLGAIPNTEIIVYDIYAGQQWAQPDQARLLFWPKLFYDKIYYVTRI